MQIETDHLFELGISETSMLISFCTTPVFLDL